jgi:hypothetical protein
MTLVACKVASSWILSKRSAARAIRAWARPRAVTADQRGEGRRERSALVAN